MLPSALEQFEDGPFHFLQDNHPVHTSRVVKDWLSFQEANHQITVLSYPPRGCDINPIENIWADMARELNCQHVRTADKLWDRVFDIWEQFALDQKYWKTFARSMPRRLAMVREMDGGWTKY